MFSCCALYIRDGKTRGVVGVRNLKKFSVSCQLKTPRSLHHHRLCEAVFISLTQCIDFVYSCIPPSSLITFKQMIKRILEWCRGLSMNVSFPLILTIWLMLMVEDNTKAGSEVPVIGLIAVRCPCP
jgi:hypothetical protein